MKKILVVGSGGREHTLVWKLSQSSQAKEIFCAPGNAGISRLATCVPINADDITGLADFAEKESIDLTVVGPEIPLVMGIVDAFRKRELVICGPDARAAAIEGSKAFAKDFMKKYNQVNIECKIAFEENDVDKISRSLEKSWGMRKKLGKMANAKIEPDSLTDMMFKFKLNGALTAGLLGAGGGDTILAICKDQEHKEHFTKYLIQRGVLFFDEVKIDNKGYEFLKPKPDIQNL